MSRLKAFCSAAVFLLVEGSLAILLCLAVSGTGGATVAYISNSLDNSVTVIDFSIDNLPMFPVGGKPLGVAVNPAGTRVYVTNYNSNTVSVIDTSLVNSEANPIVATIRVGKSPVGVAVSPDGALVYVANYNNRSASVINTATNRVITTLTVGSGPSGVAVSPDGSTIFVTSYLSGSVSVIRKSTSFGRLVHRVIATISGVSGAYGVAFHPSGARAYVANFAAGSSLGNTVSVINTATSRVIKRITVGAGPTGVAVDPKGTRANATNFSEGTRAYVTNFSEGTVSVIDTDTDTLTDTIEVGTNPYGVSVSSDGSLVFVANKGSDSVSIIYTYSNEVTTMGCGDSDSCPFSDPVAFGNFLLPEVTDGTDTLTGSFSQASLGNDRRAPDKLSTQQVSPPKASTLSAPSGRLGNPRPPHEN